MRKWILVLALLVVALGGMGLVTPAASAAPEEQLVCGRWRCVSADPWWYWGTTVVPTTSYGYWYEPVWQPAVAVVYPHAVRSWFSHWRR